MSRRFFLKSVPRKRDPFAPGSACRREAMSALRRRELSNALWVARRHSGRSAPVCGPLWSAGVNLARWKGPCVSPAQAIVGAAMFQMGPARDTCGSYSAVERLSFGCDHRPLYATATVNWRVAKAVTTRFAGAQRWYSFTRELPLGRADVPVLNRCSGSAHAVGWQTPRPIISGLLNRNRAMRIPHRNNLAKRRSET